MKIEELSKKEEVTKEEVLEYFNCKTDMELEEMLVTKMRSISRNDSILYSGFELIYNQMRLNNFNPMQEDIMFYTVALNGLHGIDIEEINLIVRGIGAFGFISAMSGSVSKEVILYHKLYKRYLARKESLGHQIAEGIEKLTDMALEFVDGIDDGAIAKMKEGIEKTLEDFKKNNGIDLQE